MKPKKSLDLATAQRLYIAAGQPEQAEAAGFVIDAVRNTVQGEWGQSFVTSLEGLLQKHIAPLVIAQKETQDAVRTLGGRFHALEARVEGLATRLDHKRVEIDQIKEQQVVLAARLAALEAAHTS